MVRHVLAAALALGFLAIGCSSSSSPAPSGQQTPAAKDGGTTTSAAPKAKPRTTPKTAAIKKLAGQTPPSGAKSVGTKTNPQLGSITVPIQEVEVYVVAFDFDGNGSNEDVQWAYVESGSTYLWLTGPMTCGDGSGGAGGFLMEVKADGTGSYLFTFEGCSSSDLFGCDFDAAGTETTCGACSVDAETQALACVVAGE
jgi:hypothetical protein